MSWLIACTLLSSLQIQPVAETPPGAVTVRLLDVTGDGLLDELRLGPDGAVSVSVNVRSKTFMSVHQTLPDVFVTSVLISDLDGDGRLDLYLVSPRHNVALLGDGAGFFRDATAALGLSDTGLGKGAERVDVDGDGQLDLILHNVGNDVLFWALAPGRFVRDTAALSDTDPLAALSETDSELLALLLASLLYDQGDTDPTSGDPTTASPPPGPAGGQMPVDAAPTGGSSVLTVGSGAGGMSFSARPGIDGPASPPIIPPALEAFLDDKYVNDDGNEVDSADIVDGSLTGADVSTSGGDVTFYGATLTADKAVFGVSSTAAGTNAAVGGGRFNVASYEAATVAGGYYNDASADYATVGGGRNNSASNNSATVAGGRYNTASGNRSTVGGGRANLASGDWATIGGGVFNDATYSSATVGGGRYNDATADYATVAGGRDNAASNNSATVAGGRFNTASGDRSTVGGGRGNLASGNWATVDGGIFNTASGYYAAVGGGHSNTASGNNAMVPGGRDNLAQGNFSLAAGRRAKANHTGGFVWGDSFNADKTSSTADEFNVYASGGTRIFSNSTATSGVLLAPGGNSWSAVSDRAAKEHLQPVDVRAVLNAVAALRITTWNYKSQDDSVRHMGPMAQDFRAAFGLGVSDRLIDTIDPDGVALAAIQGLRFEKDEEIAELRARQAVMEAQIAELMQR